MFKLDLIFNVTETTSYFLVVVSMEGDRIPQVSEDSLNATFNLAQVHFHWGSNDTHGSEHALDFKR